MDIRKFGIVAGTIVVLVGAEGGRFALYDHLTESPDTAALTRQVVALNERVATLTAKLDGDKSPVPPTPEAYVAQIPSPIAAAQAAPPAAPPSFQSYLRLQYGVPQPTDAAQMCGTLAWNIDRYVRRLSRTSGTALDQLYNEVRMGNFLTLSQIYRCDPENLRGFLTSFYPVE